MKRKKGCYYCEQDGEFQKLLFKICDLSASTIFLCKDQTLPGRCTIMYKEHYDELYEIPAEERNEFIDDVCALAQTIKEVFGADKINYAIYGDEVTHVHFTLCPKYKDKLGWAKPFVLFPDKKDIVYLSEVEYKERMALIEEEVKKRRGLKL